MRDARIFGACQAITGDEGVTREPASAASVAGVIELGEEGSFGRGSQVDCTPAGRGPEGPDSAIPGR